MQRFGVWLGLAVLITILCAACGPQQKSLAQRTPEELMRLWRELPKAGADSLDAVTATYIAQQLAASGPEGLKPLLDVLEDPEGDPVAKVLVVISLTPHLRPELAPRLLGMTAEGNETTSRACATHLLGLMNLPEVTARMRELLQDQERRVRLSAAIVMIMRQDPEVLARVAEFWNDPEVTPQERLQIVLSLPDSSLQQYLTLFAEAVVDAGMDAAGRRHALTVLGRLGDASVLPALQTCAEKDPEESLRLLAQQAIEAVQSRTAGAPPESAAVPAAVPPENAAVPAAVPPENATESAERAPASAP